MNPGLQSHKPVCLLQEPPFTQSGQDDRHSNPQNPSGQSAEQPTHPPVLSFRDETGEIQQLFKNLTMFLTWPPQEKEACCVDVLQSSVFFWLSAT